MNASALTDRRTAWRDVRRVTRRLRRRRDELDATTDPTVRGRLIAEQQADDRLRTCLSDKYAQLCAAIRRSP
jgi:hypothetical protein